MDYRLHRRADGRDFLGQFAASLGCDCDVICQAGAVRDLVRPDAGADEALLRDLRIAVERHGVQIIYLVNHENCGAYAGMKFASRSDELAQHGQDLRHACRVVQQTFPGVRVTPLFAELAGGSQDDYLMPAEPPEVPA